MDGNEKAAIAELVAGLLLGQAATLNLLTRKGLVTQEEVVSHLTHVADAKRDEGAPERSLTPLDGLIAYLVGRAPVLN